MGKLAKAKHIAIIVFNGIWLVAAAILWTAGLNEFTQDKTFLNWMVWGLICSILVIVPILRMVVKGAKDGARDGEIEGANTYTATRIGDTIHVQNDPVGGKIKGFFFGIIGGLIAGVLMGPILVAMYFFVAICNIIIHALALARGE